MSATHNRFPPMAALTLFIILGLLQSLIWIALAVYLNSQCGWMALLMALTAAMSLRLGRMAPGLFRAFWGVLLTLIGVAWANWGIVAVQMSASMGVSPQDSAGKLGVHLAMTLLGLAMTPIDYALIALAIIGAAIAAR